MISIDPGLNAILAAAFREAKKRTHEYLTPEHILFAALAFPEGNEIIRFCGGDPNRLQQKLDVFFSSPHFPRLPGVDPVQSSGFSALLETAMMHVHAAGKSSLTFGDLLASIFLLKESFARHFLKNEGIDRLDVLQILSHGLEQTPPEEELEDIKSTESEQDHVKSKALSEYANNLTQAALRGELDPVIGRDGLITRTIQVLCRRQKNNPLHIGEPGVGKTALTEGLAIRIASGKVPVSLKDHQIFHLDLSSLIAGTKYRGDFEQRMKKVLNEIVAHPGAILFIDEIHNLIGAGAVTGSTMDAANMLKPLISSRKVRCIGATTYEEYRKYFEKDRALTRRFQKIDVPEPSIQDTILILEGIKKRFEAHHRVTYSSSALRVAAEISAKFINDRFLPDKAIDVIDEAGSRIQISRSDDSLVEVTEHHIEDVVAEMTNTPRQTVQASDTQVLESLEASLKEVIFGQDQAIEAVCNAIKRYRAGFSSEDRPIASLLFIGPTGVGKTELAKQMAQKMGISLLRFDMSEYQEKHSVARLIGAPPGYVGFEQGGLLTEAIRKTPHAVLLLDEIEKAHGDIYNTLLQIMDHATLTDNSGKAADFKNIILIMTSNAGTRELTRKSIGFRKTPISSSLHKALEKTFAPEFRNRLDGIVQFNSLQISHIRLVVKSQIALLENQVNKKNIMITTRESVIDWLAKTGYSEQFGAREIRRLVDEELKPFFTKEILFGRLQQGGHVVISLQQNRPVCTIKTSRRHD